MSFLRAINDEGQPCLVNTNEIATIILMEYDEREFPFAILAWVKEDEHWVTFGEFETEAAAEAKFTQIERVANRQ